MLSIYESDERIPNISKHGKFYYNFWRDARHVRGVWRRTTLEEYRKAEPAWETVIDLDQLAEVREGKLGLEGCRHSAAGPRPRADFSLARRRRRRRSCASSISTRRQFVADGFKLPEAKSRVAWRNRDTLYVGTDFGAGSLTISGYPRVVKEWKRGTPISAKPRRSSKAKRKT